MRPSFPGALAPARCRQSRCCSPLDLQVDAAARVLDPVFRGVNDGERDCGKFYKDYNESEW